MAHTCLHINKLNKSKQGCVSLFQKIRKFETDFLSGIMDPLCAYIKLSVLSSDVLMNSFLQAENCIAGAIDMMQKNTNIPSQQVSQVTSNSTQASMGYYYIRGGCGRFGSSRGGSNRDRRERLYPWHRDFWVLSVQS